MQCFIIVTATLVIASLSWFIIEKPINKLKERFGDNYSNKESGVCDNELIIKPVKF
jgi:peptidoglycan/LPS O-acetylase OafA/YrhL